MLLFAVSNFMVILFALIGFRIKQNPWHVFGFGALGFIIGALIFVTFSSSGCGCGLVG